MLLRDADPEAHARARSNATGPGMPRGAYQPIVLQTLIDLADHEGVISLEQLGRLSSATLLPQVYVNNALVRLKRDGWIDGIEHNAVKLTGVLEQP